MGGASRVNLLVKKKAYSFVLTIKAESCIVVLLALGIIMSSINIEKKIMNIKNLFV